MKTAARYTRLAPSSDASVDVASRVVRYVFSDESVGRDGHIVKASAWQTANFEANPVFCWQHMDDVPPIGRVIDLHTQDRELCGAVKYAETDFAQMIFELVSDGYLRATSTSWMPIEATPKSGGGLIFTAVDLLEISQVSVPALPTALAQAGARGINLRPLATWAERALAAGGCKTMPRPELEAIAAASATRSNSRSSTRAQREARARELRDDGKQQRLDKARRIVERVAREDAGLAKGGDMMTTESEAKNVRAARGHLARALKHHRELSGHHDAMAAQISDFTEARRSLTSTLAELGIDDERVTRALNALDHCGRAVRRSHVAADDMADAAAGNVDRANDCICAIAK